MSIHTRTYMSVILLNSVLLIMNTINLPLLLRPLLGPREMPMQLMDHYMDYLGQTNGYFCADNSLHNILFAPPITPDDIDTDLLHRSNAPRNYISWVIPILCSRTWITAQVLPKQKRIAIWESTGLLPYPILDDLSQSILNAACQILVNQDPDSWTRSTMMSDTEWRKYASDSLIEDSGIWVCRFASYLRSDRPDLFSQITPFGTRNLIYDQLLLHDMLRKILLNDEFSAFCSELPHSNDLASYLHYAKPLRPPSEQCLSTTSPHPPKPPMTPPPTLRRPKKRVSRMRRLRTLSNLHLDVDEAAAGRDISPARDPRSPRRRHPRAGPPVEHDETPSSTQTTTRSILI